MRETFRDTVETVVGVVLIITALAGLFIGFSPNAMNQIANAFRTWFLY